METFSWQARTDEGDKIVYEATYFGGWWQLSCTRKRRRSCRDGEDPQPAEFTPEIWQKLLDLLKRKYSRRRVAWKLVQQVQDILDGKAVNERRDTRNHER